MRRSRFTETQIVWILKEAEAGRPVKEVCREYGVSSATFYKWKSKYGGMEASDIQRLKELEEENRSFGADVRRSELGEPGSQRRDLKKNIKPAQRRFLVDFVRTEAADRSRPG